VTSFAEADGSAHVTGIVSTPAGLADGGEPMEGTCRACHRHAIDDDETQARNTSQERQGSGVTHNVHGT
jgi:hypothetical protein